MKNKAHNQILTQQTLEIYPGFKHCGAEELSQIFSETSFHVKGI